MTTTESLQPSSSRMDSPAFWFAAAVAAYMVKSAVDKLTRPKNHPPFYYELPYIPWLGSLVQFAVDPNSFLQRAAKAKGNVFTIQLFGKQMTFLVGAEGHSVFFKAREHEFDIREAYAMTVTTFGPGVCYDVSQRKMAEQFAFFKDNLSDKSFVKYMTLIQDEVANYFTSEWGDEGEADLLASLSDLYTLTSSRCLLGDEIRQRWKDSGMAEHYLALDHSFVPILFFFPWIPNPHRTKCIEARKLFEKIFTEVMEERKEKRKADPKYQPPQDFLEVLMHATYSDGTTLTPTEITGILIGVLLGGQHTSNVTGTWLVAHLHHDREWLGKILQEQEEIFASKPSGKAGLHPATLLFEEVQSMPVLEQALNETLRLHPPFFQVSRSVKKEKTYNGIVIPEGHYVNISPPVSHRLTSVWGEDAETFDPNRFSDEARKELKPHQFIPFGGGMHQCCGKKFGWNSLKVSLSWLLRNYELEFVGKGATELPKEDYTTMVVAPTKSHVQVKYRRRRK